MFGIIWMILLVLVVVYLGSKLFHGVGPRQGGGPDRDDSLRIIREKYAKGEITADEYEHMKAVLSK
ncbi:SHOCT domain-containing protein [Salidesulfovibrio onnuriiensis]|uniref:SHOCT domain-containing protein n=1 Tax=Salidesulfovibrio onnuriiensis TaxID=2583823 RepID=UPI00202B744E|nr:SHOCT domain-containing protein [Salidesulfovibrio onnuriiensis]